MLDSSGAQAGMALAADRQQRHRAQGVAAAGKWVGIFQRGGQIASVETRLGKPAQGRAGAAGAQFGSAASQWGVQACTESGSSRAWDRGPSLPRRALNSHLPANACDGTIYTSVEPEPVLQGTRLRLPAGRSQARFSPSLSQGLQFWWLDAKFPHLCKKAGLVWSWCMNRGEVRGGLVLRTPGGGTGHLQGLLGGESLFQQLSWGREMSEGCRTAVRPPLPL